MEPFSLLEHEEEKRRYAALIDKGEDGILLFVYFGRSSLDKALNRSILRILFNKKVPNAISKLHFMPTV